MIARPRLAGGAVITALALLAGGCSDDTPTTTASPPTTVSRGSSVPTTASGPTTSAVTATTATTVLPAAGPSVVDDVLRGGGDADGYTYQATFPKLQGLADATVQDAVNAGIRAEVTAVVDEFISAAKEFPGPPAELGGQPSGLTGTYEVSRLDEGLASLRVRVSQFFAGAAHPGAVIRTFNYDLRSGERLALADLFTAGSPYLDRLSELSRQLLAAQPGFEDLSTSVLRGTEPKADNFAGWTLTDQDFVVTFSEYQVAPYAMGMPHVSIPFASLRLLLDPAGPLAIYN